MKKRQLRTLVIMAFALVVLPGCCALSTVDLASSGVTGERQPASAGPPDPATSARPFPR
jgi:hypothetical protein